MFQRFVATQNELSRSTPIREPFIVVYRQFLIVLMLMAFSIEGALSGIVRDEADLYKSNVLVELFTPWTDSIVYSARTDSSGSFKLDTFIEKEYHVRLSADSVPVQWFSFSGNTTNPQYKVYLSNYADFRLFTIPFNNEPNAVITVNVFDSAGLPVIGGGAAVNLYSEFDPAWTRRIELTSSNSAVFSNLIPFTYAAYLDVPPYPPQYYDSIGNFAQHRFFKVNSKEIKSINTSLTANPKGDSYIIGKILREDGFPASGFVASLFGLGDINRPLYSKSVDSDGIVNFDLIAHGSYYLKIAGDSYPAQWYSRLLMATVTDPDGSIYAMPGMYDTLRISLSKTPIDNSPQGKLVVKVFDHKGALMKRQGKVELIENYSNVSKKLIYDSTGQTYTVDKIPSGYYQIRLDSMPFYSRQYHSDIRNTTYPMYNFKIDTNDTLFVETYLIEPLAGDTAVYIPDTTVNPPVVPPDTTVSLDTSSTNGSITGMVKDINGKGFNGVPVVIFDNTGVMYRTLATDSNGFFSLSRVLSSLYYIRVDAPGYPSQYWSSSGTTSNITQSNYFTVSSGLTFNANMVISTTPRFIGSTSSNNPVTSKVFGKVMSKVGGKPVAGARILLCYPDYVPSNFNPHTLQTPLMTLTDTSGNYLFKNVPAGEYLVMAEADNQNYVAQFHPSSDVSTGGTRVKILDSNSTYQADFILRQGGILKGMIVTSDGLPVSNVMLLAIQNLQTGRNYDCISRMDGHYDMSGLPAGQYSVMVQSDQVIANDYSNEIYIVIEGQSVIVNNIIAEIGGHFKGIFENSGTVVEPSNDIRGNIAFFSDTISQIMHNPQYYINFKTNSILNTITSKEFVSGVCKSGKWNILFQPSARSYNMPLSDTTWLIPNYGWNYIGSDSNFQTIEINPLDTAPKITIKLRRGFSVVGNIQVNGIPFTGTNYHVSAYIKKNEKFIRVAFGQPVTGGRFELPGLVQNEEYYIQAGAENHPMQFWSPQGNSYNPEKPFIFDSLSTIRLNVNIIDSLGNNKIDTTIGKRFSLWNEGSSIKPVLKYAVDSSYAFDSLKLFSSDRDGAVTLLSSIRYSPAITIYTYNESRILQAMTNYVLVGKGSRLTLKTNNLTVEPRTETVLWGNIWIDAYKNNRSGVRIDWGRRDTVQFTQNDSVALFRKIDTGNWILISKVSAWQKSIEDYNVIKSDSGKTFQYKIEMLSKSLVSDIKSIKIDASFYTNIAGRILVGPYEQYKTIQDAINVALNNEIINISSGTYKENLDFKGKALTLHGEWEFGKPPMLDASGGTAITIPFSMKNANCEPSRIEGLKIQNATVGILTKGSVSVQRCLFAGVSKAIESSVDSLSLSQAMVNNPFLSNYCYVNLFQCTFIAKGQGDLVVSVSTGAGALTTSGTSENNWNSIQPLSVWGSNVFINKSLFAYYYSRAKYSTIPVNLKSNFGSLSISDCNMWQTSAVNPVTGINPDKSITSIDPSFEDTLFYFVSKNSPLRLMGVGYDANRNTNGDGENNDTVKRPSAVSNVVKKVLGMNSIGLQWNAAPQAEKIVSYRIYRVPADTNLFYINEKLQWDLKIAKDTVGSLLEIFSTVNTFYVDSTVALGRSYIYVVAAVDSNGSEGEINLSAPPALSSYSINHYQYEFNVSAGKWYMLSPWGTETSTVSQNAIVYHWDDAAVATKLLSQYTAATQMKSIYGYWFKSSMDTILKVKENVLADLKMVQDTVKCALVKGTTGWNQISSPFPFSVNPSWLVNLAAWEWNSDSSGYSRAYQLEPWKAYWVHVTRDTTVSFRDTKWPVPVLPLSKKTSAISWELDISLHGKDVWDPENKIGVISTALAKSAMLESPEPPQAFGAPQVYFVKSGASSSNSDQTQRMSHLYKSSPDVPTEKLEWLVCLTPADNVSQLKIGNVKSLPQGVYAFWVDKEGTVDLNEHNTVEIAAHSEDRYGYIVVTANLKDIALYRNTFSLRTPYPNPFRNNVRIEYTIPYQWLDNGSRDGNDRHVKIEVYDISGRRIVTLLNGKRNVGMNQIVWNGNNSRMQPVAAGLYFIKLQCDKKMVQTAKTFRIR